MKFLIAGYGLPAELGVVALIGMGVSTNDISVLTHKEDERNLGLISYLRLRNILFIDTDIRDDITRQWIAQFSPDYIVSLHYRKLIPKNILSLAKKGCMNLHPSLLPKYRGVNSVPWAIINNEKWTGFTFHYMDEYFDTGKIILQNIISISPYETAFSLFHKQIYLAMSKFEEALQLLIAGFPGTDQSEGGSYYPRELPFNGVINVSWDIQKIERFIRAMYFPPFNPAKLIFNEQVYFVSSIEEYVELSKSHDLDRVN